jgi:hypothetical protein
LSFKVEDFIYLKVSPMKGLRRFKIRGNLAPRFIGPFKILEQKGEVAYQLELPPQLSVVHDVFHVPQLKKCLRVPEKQAPLEDLVISKDLTYQESCQAIRDIRKSYPEQEDSDLQSSMEPSHKRRSHLGKRRRTEGRISKLLY